MFEFVDVLAEAVEALFDGGFGGGESFGDVADGEVFESQVEKCTFVGFEGGDEAEVVGRCLVYFLGDGVVHPVFEGYESGLLGMAAYFGDGDIEGHTAHPCVGGTVAPEVGPRLPEVADDFLVEVADCIGGAVGVVEADLEDGALAAVEHVKELCVVVVAERIRPKQGKQGMPCFGSVMLSSAVHMFVCRLLPGTCCVRLGCGQFYPLSIILVAKIRKSNMKNENIFAEN